MKKASLGYIRGIDVLRFIAATGVVLHHTSLHLRNMGLPYLTTHRNSGAFFLNLFFVISGYLISAILFKEVDTEQFKLKNFFLRRILRIWPMYFFVVLVFVIIIPIIIGVPASDIWKSLFFASLFITNYQMLFSTISKATYTIIWSVGIEEHIYILFPFFMKLLRKNKMALSLGLILVGFVSWLFGPFFIGDLPSGYNASYFLSSSYFYYFGVGCLIAVILSQKNNVLSKVNKSILHPIVQVTIILSGFIFIFKPGFDTSNIFVFLVFNALFSAYLVYCAACSKLVLDVFSDKLSRFLGNVSYPMYLLHIKMVVIGVFLVKKIDMPYTFKFDIILPIIVVSLTMLLSSLCHYLIERPFLKLKKKYTVVPNK